MLVKCRFGSIFARTVKDAKLATGSGTVQIGSTSGSVIIKNANGPIEVTNCQGDIYVRTKAGDISISKALASVTAKASFGTISINEVSSGHVSAQTNIGAIQIGIQKGVFASVGAISKYGIVQNDIAKSSKPNSTVEVYAKTKVGNITINQITV